MLEAASRPALYVGVGIRRHGLTEAVVRLAERLRLPVVTDLLGKAAFPESHPQFAGVYLGALGDPGVRSLLDESDCVLGIGVVATDLGTGFWTQRIDPRARVMIDPDGVQVRYHRYDGLPIAEVVARPAGTIAGLRPAAAAARCDGSHGPGRGPGQLRKGPPPIGRASCRVAEVIAALREPRPVAIQLRHGRGR